MNHGNNFGFITIDWSQPDPIVRLQIRAEEGEVTIQEKLPLSLLQPGSMKSKGIAGVVRINDKLFTPELLKEWLNKEVTLQMKVAATGQAKSGELIFLNSSADFRSEENFTVVLSKDAQESLEQGRHPCCHARISKARRSMWSARCPRSMAGCRSSFGQRSISRWWRSFSQRRRRRSTPAFATRG